MTVPDALPRQDVPPDWSTVSSDILCPLCDYNLRGLVEPRCPECGHKFIWSDLIDPGRRGHPWLFEHQDRRRIRAFLHTFFVSQFPQRFWKSVRPHHTPRLGRLIRYWMLTVACILPLILYEPALQLVGSYRAIYRIRQQVALQTPQLTGDDLKTYLDRAFRYPSLLEAVSPRSTYLPFGRLQARRVLIPVGIAIILWPWITMLSLIVFRSTMRQARISSSHVIRCAVYASDASFILVLLLIPFTYWWLESTWRWIWRTGSIATWAGFVFEPVMFSLLLVGVAVLTFRLWVAYRRYLQFPHAFATCVASQCMTILVLILIYVSLLPQG